MFPQTSDYPKYAASYVNSCKSDVINDNLQKGGDDFYNYLKTISEEKSLFKYGEDKWTVRELVQHVIDAERIFSYRACRIARKDKTSLNSFDENDFAKNSDANARTLESLREEFLAVRKSSLHQFKNFTDEMLQQKGGAHSNPVTVHAIGFIIPGHAWHHLTILQTRYFPAEKMN